MRLVALKKTSVISLILAVLVALTIGGYLTSTLMMQGIMHACPFMDMPALCHMTPLQHLAQWQNTVTAVQPLGAYALLLILALVLATRTSTTQIFLKRSHFQLPSRHRARTRFRILSPLQLALTRGIIHSKVF